MMKEELINKIIEILGELKAEIQQDGRGVIDVFKLAEAIDKIKEL